MTRDRLVGTGKAADALGISRQTLARWAADGHVTPAHETIGGHFRWSLTDLQHQIAAITGREAPPMTATPETPVELPVVAAVVTSDRGMLVTWRNDKNPPAGFLTGEIEPGESPADAMVRECKEEAGLLVAADREIFRRVHPKTGRTIIYVAGHPTGTGEVSVTDDYELADVNWVDLATADESFAVFGGMAKEVHDYLADALS